MKSAGRHPRRTLVAVALLAAALALTACSGQEAGSAATLGDSRITEQDLTSSVQAVLTAQGKPVDTADAELTNQTLGRLIIVNLANLLSEQKGIVVSQGEIDAQLGAYLAQYGDQTAMNAAFAAQGLAPDQLQSIVRVNLQAQKLGVQLAPDATPDEQGQAVLKALTDLSTKLNVTASPRFGTWDNKTLRLGPPPNDLSVEPSAAP